jgi:hypothetical protein
MIRVTCKRLHDSALNLTPGGRLSAALGFGAPRLAGHFGQAPGLTDCSRGVCADTGEGPIGALAFGRLRDFVEGVLGACSVSAAQLDARRPETGCRASCGPGRGQGRGEVQSNPAQADAGGAFRSRRRSRVRGGWIDRRRRH